LNDEKISFDQVEISHSADMQYEGQTYTLRIPLVSEELSTAALKQRLADAFQSRFGIDLSGFRAQLINIRTSITGIRPEVDLRSICLSTPKCSSASEAIIGKRLVWFEGGWVETPIYDRSILPIGAVINGPAIFNQLDTTTVAEPGDVITVDEFGNLIVEVSK
jgi:N-methylhydantoinase A